MDGVHPDEIFLYLDKNWRTVNYNATIAALLKKFEDSLINESDEKRRWAFEDLKEQWEKEIMPIRSDEVNGHLSSCKGAGKCDCCVALYTMPREFIAKIVYAYTPAQCIIEQMKLGFRIESVLSNFRINWRKMDMRNVMQKLLKFLSDRIALDKAGELRKTFYNSYFVPVPKHDIDECNPYFYHGFVTCDCLISATCTAPRKFIEKLIIAYYTRRSSSKPHACHICDAEFDHLPTLLAHKEKDHVRCGTCGIYIPSADMRDRNHFMYCKYYCHGLSDDSDSHSDTYMSDFDSDE